MTKVNEIFMPIKGYEGIYEISNYGQVRSINRIMHTYGTRYCKIKGRVLKIKINDFGYACVTLPNEGKLKYAFVHRLVAETFINNIENKPFVNHVDGLKLNNAVSNLEWCTQSENELHAYKTGLKNQKFGNGNNASLGNIEAVAIYNSGDNQYDLAIRYNVSQAAISNIKSGKTWSSITGKQYKRKAT